MSKKENFFLKMGLFFFILIICFSNVGFGQNSSDVITKNSPQKFDFSNSYNKLAKRITSMEYALYASGTIVFFATTLLIYFLIRVTLLDSILKNFINKIKTSKSRGYDLLNDLFHEKILFKKLFDDFFNSSCFRTNFQGKDVVYRIDSSKFYFDYEVIIRDYVNLDFWKAFPNYLTGAGILGTFVGLVSGIYLASEGLTSDKSEHIKSALNYLLSGASIAFFTSIAGLISSIVFSTVKKMKLHFTYNNIEKLSGLIDASIVRTSTEETNKNILDKTEEYLSQIKTFNTDLALAIADKIDEKFKNGNLGEAINNLVDAVNGMRNDRVSENKSAIEGMLEKFQSNLTGNAGSQIEKMSHTIEQVSSSLSVVVDKLEVQQNQSIQKTKEANDNIVDALNYTADKIDKLIEKSMSGFAQGITDASVKVASNIENSSQQMESVLLKVLEKIELMFTNSSENFEKHQISLLEKIENSVDLLVGQMNSTGNNFIETLTETKNVINDLKQFSNTINSLLISFNEVGTVTQNVTSNLSNSAEVFEKSASNMKDYNENSSRSIKVIQENIGTLKDINDNVQLNWEKYADRFEGSEEAAKKIFNEIQNGLLVYKEKIKDFNQEMDDSFSRAISRLSSVIGELGEIIEEFEKKNSR